MIRKQRSLLDFAGELKANSTVSDAMREAIRSWVDMYTNLPDEDQSQRSLNLASGICREYARLVCLELSSEVSDNDDINEIYQETVVKKLRNFVEKACARGTAVLKPRVDGNGHIKVDFVTAENFIPLATDSDGDITAALFGAFCQYDNYYYTLVEHHELNEGDYTIDYTVYKSKELGALGKRVTSGDFPPCWRGITERLEFTNIAKPLYSVFKVPFQNNIDENSKLGVSIFSNAMNLIMDADKIYSSLLWEYKGGEMAVYADTDCLTETEYGVEVLPEHTKRLVRKFTGNTIDSENFYSVFAPQLRDEAYNRGLNAVLKRIEFNCNVAYGTLSDPNNVDKTAEEIKASKQRTYAAVVELQSALENTLKDVIKVIDYWYAIINNGTVSDHSTVFSFGDSVISIITDREQEYKERLELTKLGYCAPWEMRAWYFGEDEETAKKRIGLIDLV